MVMVQVPFEQATPPVATLGREAGAGQATPQTPQLSTLVRRSIGCWRVPHAGGLHWLAGHWGMGLQLLALQ
jgi:hypothetical protein